MEDVPIEVLRTAFAQSIIATMATQVSCYLRLATHPEAQFADFLDALSRNAVIGDDAAMRLRRRLGTPDDGEQPGAQRAHWEQVLRERGIDPATPFRLPDAQPQTPTAST